jgi:glutamine cyclotransferase
MLRASVLAVAFLLGFCQVFARQIPVYGYTVVNEYPHDSTAFTQGLVFEDGFLYEGTGLYGSSSLRKVELETGDILKIRNLDPQYFGEGVTIFRDTIIQVTWRSNVGFVYIEADTFELIDTFTYPTEGWGLTHDGTHLIMSDGSSTLYFADPHTYELAYQIEVRANGYPVERLNELEYIQGNIYANIWVTDNIAIINPQTGEVTAWLNLTGLLDPVAPLKVPGVLNGIAFDPESVRLFVTGKLWPTLFEIDVAPLNYPPTITLSNPSSPCSIEVDSSLLLSVSVEDPDSQDVMEYIWTVNGEVDTSARDSSYLYTSSVAAVDTVEVEVTDGMFSDMTSWTVLVSSTAIEAEDSLSQVSFSVPRAFPNPFKEFTTITYGVAERTWVSLQIYDTNGRIVRRLVDDEQERGVHSITLAAEELQSGVYFIRFVANTFDWSQKLILVR